MLDLVHKLLFPLYTKIFLHQFCLWSPPFSTVCEVFFCFFFAIQYLKSPAVKYKSVFFYLLANRKKINKFTSVHCIIFSWNPFFKNKFTDRAALLDSPEETHCEDHGKELRKRRKIKLLADPNPTDKKHRFGKCDTKTGAGYDSHSQLTTNISKYRVCLFKTLNTWITYHCFEVASVTTFKKNWEMFSHSNYLQNK